MQKAKFILSKKKVLEQYKLIEPFADTISYSSKTNQDITKILEENTSCLFSVHFENELKHIKDMSRVLFLSQALSEEQISRLLKKGINKFVVDNESDLDILISYLRKHDDKISLLLRLKLKELTIKTERYFVFGMPSDVINRRIREISKDPLLEGDIGSLGIHFFRKTQNVSEWNLRYQIEEIIDDDVLDIIDVMNIGGGFPSEYANTNINVLTSVFDKVTEMRDWLKEKDIQMMIEPGRIIAAPAVKLETTIIGIHGKTIIVNASVYNSDMDALIVPVKLLIENELNKEDEGEDYVVKGETPCSLDLFRYKVRLNNPKIGDKLVFLNAGAYNFTTDFCDLEKIETIVE